VVVARVLTSIGAAVATIALAAAAAQAAPPAPPRYVRSALVGDGFRYLGVSEYSLGALYFSARTAADRRSARLRLAIVFRTHAGMARTIRGITLYPELALKDLSEASRYRPPAFRWSLISWRRMSGHRALLLAAEIRRVAWS
jgi:hypothetical protein